MINLRPASCKRNMNRPGERGGGANPEMIPFAARIALAAAR
jgi:hypothetical protein